MGPRGGGEPNWKGGSLKKKEKKRIKKALMQIVEGKGGNLAVSANESIKAAKLMMKRF